MAKNAIYTDDFHTIMATLMRQNYHNKGGKQRKQIRDYIKRYDLTNDFVADCETLQDKVEKLKRHAKEVRQAKKAEAV